MRMKQKLDAKLEAASNAAQNQAMAMAAMKAALKLRKGRLARPAPTEADLGSAVQLCAPTLPAPAEMSAFLDAGPSDVGALFHGDLGGDSTDDRSFASVGTHESESSDCASFASAAEAPHCTAKSEPETDSIAGPSEERVSREVDTPTTTIVTTTMTTTTTITTTLVRVPSVEAPACPKHAVLLAREQSARESSMLRAHPPREASSAAEAGPLQAGDVARTPRVALSARLEPAAPAQSRKAVDPPMPGLCAGPTPRADMGGSDPPPFVLAAVADVCAVEAGAEAPRAGPLPSFALDRWEAHYRLKQANVPKVTLTARRASGGSPASPEAALLSANADIVALTIARSDAEPQSRAERRLRRTASLAALGREPLNGKGGLAWV
jgi:hypothetical protein